MTDIFGMPRRDVRAPCSASGEEVTADECGQSHSRTGSTADNRTRNLSNVRYYSRANARAFTCTVDES